MKVCGHCGRLFFPQNPDAVYCCLAHRRAAHRGRKRRRKREARPCGGKHWHASIEDAAAYLTDDVRSVYRCPYGCHGYHLTKKLKGKYIVLMRRKKK